MTPNTITRLMLAAGFCAASGVAMAQGTPPGTTPTTPAPETTGTMPSGMSRSDSSMSTGTDTMPSKADCDKMMMDHKKNQSSSSTSSSGSMNTAMDAQKMKQCESMKKKMN